MTAQMPPQDTPVRVVAFYHFASLGDLEEKREALLALCRAYGVRGTVLLAPEGVNGTISGGDEATRAVLAHIREYEGCSAIMSKESAAPEIPFNRMKVRLKREIVTMGQPGVDPAARVGRYVDPVDWNTLIAREDVVLIDTRNDYEVEIGTFKGAIDPATESFRDFPAWWEREGTAFEGKTVAMFCTGGIRCEKATSWLVGQGVEDVVHLKGGILKYLEDIPQEQSCWEGECFVFDQRVAVGHGLKGGTHKMCHACRRPLSQEAMQSTAYEHGVSCPACIDSYTDADRARFRERQKQVLLAAAEGRNHLAVK